jgi:hypothetical protein
MYCIMLSEAVRRWVEKGMVIPPRQFAEHLESITPSELKAVLDMPVKS